MKKIWKVIIFIFRDVIPFTETIIKLIQKLIKKYKGD